MAGLGSHLAEGGFATVLANWALREGEHWSLRPRRWVEGTGCDAWILRSETQDALTYAAVWTRGPEAAGYLDALDRWTAHYEALGIRSLVMGALVLRRRTAGPTWVRADELPAPPDRNCSAALLRVFAGEDRLRTLEGDAALLDEVLRVAEPLRLRQTVAFRDGTPEVQEAELSLADGLPLRESSASSSCATADGAFARSWRRWPARPGPTRATSPSRRWPSPAGSWRSASSSPRGADAHPRARGTVLPSTGAMIRSSS